MFFSQNPDYFISSYKGDRQTKNTTNRRPPTQNETFQHHQYLDGQIFQQKYELFSNYFHYIATQNSCQWHFHRRVAWHMAGHKEVGFVWQELQLKLKIWMHTSYLSPALLQCLQRNQKLYILVKEFQWILAHFVEHECKFCCDLCAFCLEKTSAKDLACGEKDKYEVWMNI